MQCLRADQLIVASTRRAVVDINQVFVLRFVKISFDAARFSLGSPFADEEILVIVVALFQQHCLFVAAALGKLG